MLFSRRMVDAYCWPQSIPSDGAHTLVDIHVSSSRWDCIVSVTRSQTQKEVYRSFPLHCKLHPTPDEAYSFGCGWPSVLSIDVKAWESDLYIVKVMTNERYPIETLAYFVVTPAEGKKSPILLVLSTTTWNAYNDWGGRCLYTGATRVSFERPLANGFLHKTPSQNRKKTQPIPGDKEALYYTEWAKEHHLSVWSGSSGWWNWERLMYEWLIDNDYKVDVATSVDLHANPHLLSGHKVFLSVGHDEYWSAAMRDHVEAFRASGGHVCILSGNTCFWQVRMENNNREMVCYKYTPEKDPVLGTSEQRSLATQWVDRRVHRPEQSTIGLSFSRGGYSRYGNGVPRASGGYTIYRSEHWVFAGTNLCYGDVIGLNDCIVAYETDGCEFTMTYGVPEPTFNDGAPRGLTILAMAPARLWSQYEQPSRYSEEPGELEAIAMAIHGEHWKQHAHKYANNHCVIAIVDATESEGILFNVGVTDWAYALEGRDSDVETITKNVLNRMLRK